MASNYGELKTEIADYLDRDDLTSKIPGFIEKAIQRINFELDHRRFEVRSTNTIDARRLGLPDDYLRARNIEIKTSPPRNLQFRTPASIDDLRRSQGDATGTPRYFTQHGNELEFYPAATTANSFEIEIIYRAELEQFVEDTDTNWVLLKNSGLMLHACLIEAYLYLKDTKNAGTNQSIFLESVAKMEELDKTGRYPASPRRVPRGVTP